jgi:twitching motility protein PilU
MNELRLAIKLEGHEAQGRDPFAEVDTLKIMGDQDDDSLNASSFMPTATRGG